MNEVSQAIETIKATAFQIMDDMHQKAMDVIDKLRIENEALKKQLESQKLYAELGKTLYEWNYDNHTSDFDFYITYRDLINQIQESEASNEINK